jgi:hypothetical protein
MGKYAYLKKYVDLENRDVNQNSFHSFKIEEIKEAEDLLNKNFPEELKEFWKEIGYGFFFSSCPEKNISQKDWVNRLLPPEDIASILLEGSESGLMVAPAYELYQGLKREGDFPFFEIGDSYDFLYMNFNKPGVYELDGNKIADSLEEFVYRLYYESPIYYLNIVD